MNINVRCAFSTACYIDFSSRLAFGQALCFSSYAIIIMFEVFYMCGITGMVSFAGNAVCREEFTLFNDSLSHRGPDGGGIFISSDTTVFLGHRRLT